MRGVTALGVKRNILVDSVIQHVTWSDIVVRTRLACASRKNMNITLHLFSDQQLVQAKAGILPRPRAVSWD